MENMNKNAINVELVNEIEFLNDQLRQRDELIKEERNKLIDQEKAEFKRIGGSWSVEQISIKLESFRQ